MSDSDWSKEAIFDAPRVQHDVRERIKIERPAEIERVAAPPVQPELRAILDNPQLAEQLWQQADAGPTQRVLQPGEKPIQDAETLAQMGLALYLLHALHFQGKPGVEHLIRDEPTLDDDEDRPR